MAVLDGVLPRSFVERVKPAMAANRRLAMLAGAAIAATIVGTAMLWSDNSAYSVLFAGLSGEQGGLALNELQKLNIPYRITEGGRVIMVPAAEVGRARLQLAARGVPKQGGSEWGLLDNEALGVSPFVEQVHYVRGLEAALSHTIGEVEGVVSAKVTLALPKRTEFLNDEPKPSASVLVRVRPDVQLSKNQVSGIVGLVASSVPGLTRENVTVIDQSGAVLSGGDKNGLQDIPEQFAIVHQIDARYEALIRNLLIPVVGAGNARVSVDANIDFSQTKQSSVRYGEGHVLSQDQTTREQPAGADEPTGIPGALSNRPPGTPSAPLNARASQSGPNSTGQNAQPPAVKDHHAITNYNLDQTVESVQDAPWKLRAISVAVLVNNPTDNPLPAERINSIKTLVTSAIGAGDKRDVTVVGLPFEASSEAPAAALPWWKQPWVRLAEQNALLAAAGLLALFGGLFPALRWLGLRPRFGVPGTAGAHEFERNPPHEPRVRRPAVGHETREQPPHYEEAAPSLDASEFSDDAFSVDVEIVRKIVTNDPGRTAQVIKEWISRGRSGR